MNNILEVDRLSREYPGRRVVDEVSFEVHQGSIHGFLGPNGAGKSTTMRMIAGLLTATSGKVKIFGEEMNTDRQDLKVRIGLLPENPPLYLDQTVADYLHFVAKLHRLKNQKEKVNEVLESLSLTEVRKRMIGNLSKGYKQRVGLAQAIIYDAPFLMLDEPTNGLDPQSVVELREFIRALAKNKTILFSSHILSEVEQICDHITIIHEGKIKASGSLSEIHRKFHQGLVLRIGIKSGTELPDLSSFGKYDVSSSLSLTGEEQYHLSFEKDEDIRGDLVRYLLSKNIELLTLQVEPPELEDIFLHMTESKK
jgi:ABC-2 type transport system ATP-binding protein